MSTPDTSSDDAMLAVAEAWESKLGTGDIKEGHLCKLHLGEVLAIARRLQSERDEARELAMRRCEIQVRQSRELQDLRAENRELRADLHSLSKRVAQLQRTADLHTAKEE